MREEKVEYCVVYEREHFEPIRKYECKTQHQPKFNKIKVKWAINLADFDITIKRIILNYRLE